MTIPPNSTAAQLADKARSTRRKWLGLAAALVAVKVAWLLVDHTPMLFLGDSESYLATALIGWIPPDRSFLYGFLLRPLVVATGSLTPLIVVQASSSVAAALLLACVLTGFFALPLRAAFAVALAWAAGEPLALLYERYVMTEAFALAALAAFVTVSLRYISTRRWRDLVLAQAAATLVIAFRSVFVPISLVFAAALPVLAWARLPRAGDAEATRRGLVLALLASIAATALFHQAYKVTNGRLSAHRPAYQYADGLFLLAAWAPIVTARDFPDPAMGEAVIAASNCKLADRFTREAQRWYPGCVVDVLRSRVDGEQRANAVARSIAMNALRRDPVGVVRLGFATWLDGFDPRRLRAALRWDRGEFAYSDATVALLRDRFGVAQAGELHSLETPTNRWHAVAVPWVMALELVPFIALIALLACPRIQRRHMAFVALLATCIIGASAIASTGPVPRYLHAVAWLAMIPMSVLGGRVAHVALRSAHASG